MAKLIYNLNARRKTYWAGIMAYDLVKELRRLKDEEHWKREDAQEIIQLLEQLTREFGYHPGEWEALIAKVHGKEPSP